MLDYPNKTDPNIIYLMKGEEIIYTSVYQEEGLDSDHFIDAYLAYSPAGEASGQLVYVNYGSKADFELLANETSEYYTEIAGKICIARYGQVLQN